MSRTFMSAGDFAFLQPIEQAWELVRDEYLAIADSSKPWREFGLHNGGWHVLGMVLHGEKRPFFDACPATMEMLRDVPGLDIAGFSILKPGAVIKPHVGYSDRLLRAHLPLKADGLAFLDVGAERHHWKLGQFMVFDDRVRHSAANPGPLERVVLTLDFDKTLAAR